MDTKSQQLASQLTRLGLAAGEVAVLLGVSTRHVWAMHSAAQLPRPVKLGHSTRWNRLELEQWLAAGAPPRDRWERERGMSQ